MDSVSYLESRIKFYNDSRNFHRTLNFVFEVMSVMFLAATPVLLALESQPIMVAIPPLNSDQLTPQTTRITKGELHKESQPTYGQSSQNTPPATALPMETSNNRTLALFSSISGLVAGLSQKYGWKKHWLRNEKTAEAIQWQLNLLEAGGIDDKNLATKTLDKVHQIEKDHLNLWAKDLQEE